METITSSFFHGSSPVVLVAGGAGFIGSHFCETLLAKKLKVICVDNWQTGLRENINHLEKNENFLLLEQDIDKNFNKNTEHADYGIERVDYIVHLAGVEAYINGEDVSIQTLSTNSIGTRNLLDLAKKHQAKFLLASVIDIFSAKISIKDVSSYFGENRSDEGAFSHLEAKRFAEALVSEYGQKENTDVRIVRLGDVYGPRMLLSTGNPAARLFKQAVYNEPLEVSSKEGVLYPIFITDVVGGLTKALFTSGTKNSIIALTGPATHIMSFAQTIKALCENLDVKFQGSILGLRKENIPDDVLLSGRKLISWEPQTTINQGINTTLEWFNQHKNKLVLQEMVEKKKEPLVLEKPQKKQDLKKQGFWTDIAKISSPHNTALLNWKKILAGSFLLFFVWFFIFPFLELGAGVGVLYAAKTFLIRGDYDKVKKTALVSDWFLEKGKVGFDRWFFIPGLGKPAKNLIDKTRTLYKTSLVVRKTGDVLDNFDSLMVGIFGKEEYSLEDIASQASLNLQSLEKDLAFAQSEDEEELKGFFGEDMASLRDSMRAVLGILPKTPELLGQTKKKTYVLVVQDDSELRPTGGLISVLVFLNFERGRLISFEVQEAGKIDSILKGSVEPPEAIKKYLGQATWLFQDANWSPNFPSSGERIAWFLDKAERSVDGVIAVDLGAVKGLLGVLGPVQPEGFGKSIDSNNFYGEIEKAKDQALLAAIVNQIISQITKEAKTSLVSIGKVFLTSFENRNASVWAKDREVAKKLKNTGWDGSVKTLVCPAEKDMTCIKDFIYPVEANLGVNRANAFLSRTYSLEISFQDNSVFNKLLISYKNDSQPGSWPGGDYKNYLRVLVPVEAKNPQATLFSPDDREGKLVNIEEGEEVGKKVLGMLVNVPAEATRQLAVSWELPQAYSNKSHLLLLLQKQPGLKEDPLWVKIDLPKDSQAEPYPTASLTSGDTLGYNTTTARDFFANIIWQQK